MEKLREQQRKFVESVGLTLYAEVRRTGKLWDKPIPDWDNLTEQQKDLAASQALIDSIDVISQIMSEEMSKGE